MSTIQIAILSALRHGPLNHFQIAADISEAPFLVRAELKPLKRNGYVIDRLAVSAVIWDLTAKGAEVAAQEPMDLEAALGDGRR